MTAVRKDSDLVSYNIVVTGAGSLEELALAVKDWQGLVPQEPTLQCPRIVPGFVSDHMKLVQEACFDIYGIENYEPITTVRDGEVTEQYSYESRVNSLLDWLAAHGWQAVIYTIAFSRGVVTKYNKG